MERAQINGEDVIIKQIEQTRDGETTYAPFGVDDENVELHYVESNLTTPMGNLRTFYNNWLRFKTAWENFLAEAMHIQYGENSPNDNHVKVWYDTSEDTVTS